MKETMFERIKRMDEQEMQSFVYAVYMAGNLDGRKHLCDSDGLPSYFGSEMVYMSAEDWMPNDDVSDLWNSWELN